MRDRPLELVRGLGIWPSVAIVAGTMIGTEFFWCRRRWPQREIGCVVFAAWIVGVCVAVRRD